jgi:hypothetical protein
MKKFFNRASKQFASLAPSTPSSTTTPHTTGLQPKYVVPPVPHPCPHDHIALLATPTGLLLRQHIPGRGPKDPGPTTHLRLQWSKTVKVEELSGPGEGEDFDWTDSVIVYGIVGVLELFDSAYSDSCFPTPLYLFDYGVASYLLVVTARSDVGNRKRTEQPAHKVDFNVP